MRYEAVRLEAERRLESAERRAASAERRAAQAESARRDRADDEAHERRRREEEQRLRDEEEERRRREEEQRLRDEQEERRRLEERPHWNRDASAWPHFELFDGVWWVQEPEKNEMLNRNLALS